MTFHPSPSIRDMVRPTPQARVGGVLWLDVSAVNGLWLACSGCSKPDKHEKTEHLPFRFRSKKLSGDTVPPCLWSLLPTGIVTTPGASLTWRLSPEPLMYGFVSESKLTPGTGSLRSRKLPRHGIESRRGAGREILRCGSPCMASSHSHKFDSVGGMGGCALFRSGSGPTPGLPQCLRETALTNE